MTLTFETAQAEREAILRDVHFHRTAAKRRLRDLERLEADCARVGIRLVRVSVRPITGESNVHRAHPDAG